MRTLLALLVASLAGCASKTPADPAPPQAADAAQAPSSPNTDVSTLEPFETDDGRMGYRDETGKVRIAPEFLMATSFLPGGIAWVAASDALYWIDAKGRRVAQAYPYDNGADEFVEGRARIIEGGKVGFIDESGQVVVRARFDFLGPLDGGRAPFCNGCVEVQDGEHSFYDGGVWGLIDRDGNVLDEAER